MLRVVGFKSVDALIDATVPADIRREVRPRASRALRRDASSRAPPPPLRSP